MSCHNLNFHLDDAQPLDVVSFPHPKRKETSSPPATIPNVTHLLDKYGIQVRYDVIKKKVLITFQGQQGVGKTSWLRSLVPKAQYGQQYGELRKVNI